MYPRHDVTNLHHHALGHPRGKPHLSLVVLHENVEVRPSSEKAEDGVQERLQFPTVLQDAHEGAIVRSLRLA